MNVALDTNAYSAFMRGEPSRINIVRAASRILMPLFVLAELRAGFTAGSKSASNAANLQRFLGTPRVSILAPDEATTHQYAQLFAFLRRRGTPIPANDLWIASLSIQSHPLHIGFALRPHSAPAEVLI